MLHLEHNAALPKLLPLMARSQVVLVAPLIQTFRDPCEVIVFAQSIIKSRLEKQASFHATQDNVARNLHWIPRLVKRR